MGLIDPSFFILGLIMASAMENEPTTTTRVLFTAAQGLNSSQYNLTTEMPSTKTTMHNTSISHIASDMNITSPNITTAPSTTAPSTTAPSTTATSTTEQKGGETTKGGITNPIGRTKTTSDKKKKTDKKPTTTPQTEGDLPGIAILIVIILVALGFGVACFIVRKRGRRYSVDFTSRQDEANIPLSIVDPEFHADTVSQNGLTTFESTETKAKEPQGPEGQEEENKSVAAEADKSVVDPGAESAAAAPSPHDSEDKPKEDVAEPSPTPAPVQPSAEEKTDDEGTVSNKTSVESLRETNENNSNSADFRQPTELDSSNIFRDVPLDSPV
ncbi:mucin-2 [Platichthys flesus]|uniref:mucin-2 n=1 Tax=Platichthys flesus TaxID=8260 RepID=UPI002DB5CFE2|nr:mucin-2 [Platichthys flesus]